MVTAVPSVGKVGHGTERAGRHREWNDLDKITGIDWSAFAARGLDVREVEEGETQLSRLECAAEV